MKCVITANTPTRDWRVEITETEFQDIQHARARALFGLAFEEKFDLVVENYADLERDILNIALRQSIRPTVSILSGAEDRRLLTRRLANLLSTGKTYVDQLHHDLSKAYGHGSEIAGHVKRYLSQEYDTSLGYRVMEAVRNHTQHRNLPIQVISYPMTWVDGSDPRRMRCTTVPWLDLNELQDDPKFKKSLIKELRSFVPDRDRANPDRQWVDAGPLFREYIDAIGRIHGQVRKLVSSDLASADAVIENVRDRARSATNGSLAGLSIGHEDDGQVRDSEWVTTEFSDRRRTLAKTNRHLASVSRRYVSSIDGPLLSKR